MLDAGCWMRNAECGSAGVQTFASGVREGWMRNAGCRSADISFWLMAATISPHGFHP